MKLYKYKSLRNLWHVLDIIIYNRFYCAHWSELNDPLEGRYEFFLGDKNIDKQPMIDRIEHKRDQYRIASLSASATNFLLWSHYADGHKGIAIEVEIPEDYQNLAEVRYLPFSCVFTDAAQTENRMRHLFEVKTLEWQYEEEYRIIVNARYFQLPNSVSRILLGPKVDDEQVHILRKSIQPSIELVKMEYDRTQGTMVFPNV